MTDKKLSEICTIIAGQSPSSDTYNKERNGLPFYQGKADFGLVSPTPRVWCSNPLRIAEKGDILLSVRAPVGPTNMANEKCCIGRGLCAIRANDEVDNKYLISYFKMFEENISKLGSGSTFSAITTEDVKNLVVPLPPIDAQRRIAAEIERQLAAVERARKAAAEQLAAARGLNAAYLREVFEGNDWEKVRLGDIGDVCMCKRIFKDQTTPQGDVPFYKIGTFGGNADAFISQEVYETYRSQFPFPQKGDVLISASGTLGRLVIYDGEPAYFQDSNIVWIDNDESKLLNRYLYHVYATQPWTGTDCATIARLYNDNIREAKIPSPPIDEQYHIIEYLGEKYEKSKKIVATIQAQLDAINAIPAAILRQAFSGQL